MAQEILVLDPSEVADGRTELALHPADGSPSAPIMIRTEGPDWGDAEVTPYDADGRYGSVPVAYRQANRVVTVPLLVQDLGTPARQLQQKVALLQREGGWLKRELPDGSVRYMDVVGATLGMGGGSAQAAGLLDNEVDLSIEYLPDSYGDEEELAVTGGDTGSGEWIGVVSVPGDHPARCRIVATEGSGSDQLGLLVGVRSRHYDDASTAALVYEAEDLTPLDAAAIVTLSGASGGASNNAVRHNNLSTEWTPVLSTEHATDGDLTHVGSYRVWARVYSSSSSTPSLRFLWDVGDFTAPAINDSYTIPMNSASYLADLGEIRIDKFSAGVHRWKGVIQAKGVTSGDNVYIDKLWLQPLDEFASRAIYGLDTNIGLSSYSARDGFNQAAGNLSGKSATVGGAWATTGATTDFAVEATGHTVQRSTSVVETGPRLASVGSSLTTMAVRADVTLPAIDAGKSVATGVVGRYVDGSNYFSAYLQTTDASRASLVATKTVAGGHSGGAQSPPFAADGTTIYRIGLIVTSTGRYVAWVSLPDSDDPIMVVGGQDSALATGGTLASGKPGLTDWSLATSPGTRTLDNFAAWVPTTDAVIFANQSLEIRHDAFERETSDGGSYSRITPIGDLVRLPASGVEDRPCEIFLKATRGDFDRIPDSAAADALSVTVNARPSWLFRP